MAAKRIHLIVTTQAHPSLSELRSKTDRQLVVLAAKGIDRSVSLAIRGAAFAEAEAERLQAGALLRVARAPGCKRRELEARLDQARAAIERSRCHAQNAQSDSSYAA